MASNVDFGLWYDFRNPEPWQIDFEQFYSERLDQIARAEGMGFRLGLVNRASLL